VHWPCRCVRGPAAVQLTIGVRQQSGSQTLFTGAHDMQGLYSQQSIGVPMSASRLPTAAKDISVSWNMHRWKHCFISTALTATCWLPDPPGEEWIGLHATSSSQSD